MAITLNKKLSPEQKQLKTVIYLCELCVDVSSLEATDKEIEAGKELLLLMNQSTQEELGDISTQNFVQKIYNLAEKIGAKLVGQGMIMPGSPTRDFTKEYRDACLEKLRATRREVFPDAPSPAFSARQQTDSPMSPGLASIFRDAGVGSPTQFRLDARRPSIEQKSDN